MIINLPACELCGKKNVGEFYVREHDIAIPACSLKHARQAAQARHDQRDDPCYWKTPAAAAELARERRQNEELSK
jgi:hypothetical protein